MIPFKDIASSKSAKLFLSKGSNPIINQPLYFKQGIHKSAITQDFLKQTTKRYDQDIPNAEPKTPLRILLVRHGEGLGNVDKSLLISQADHSIPLSEVGMHQAMVAAQKIKTYFKLQDDVEIKETGKATKKHRRMWVSPYKRTRQTAEHIMKACKEWITDSREHILLSEQQFGLFEGHTLEQLNTLYPQEFAHFQKCVSNEGRFWARPPLGESRFDVCQRIHQAFGTFHRDAHDHNIKDLIIVSHGVALRAFVMMWLHCAPEWFEREQNPKLCSVRLLEDNLDKGYIFEGFSDEDNFQLKDEY